MDLIVPQYKKNLKTSGILTGLALFSFEQGPPKCHGRLPGNENP
jgi:hypothetical protein